MVYITIWGWKSTGGDSKLDFGTSRTSSNVDKTMINHPMFDGLYHPFMVILGMVYDFFNHIQQICP